MCENAKILCPYCLTREIDPAQAICSACYSKEDKVERGSWDDLRKRKHTDEIQMFTMAKKVDEAFLSLIHIFGGTSISAAQAAAICQETDGRSCPQLEGRCSNLFRNLRLRCEKGDRRIVLSLIHI